MPSRSRQGSTLRREADDALEGTDVGPTEGQKGLQALRGCARLSARPYLSVAKLKNFRDTLAHGKPEDKIFDNEVVATAEELEAMGILHAEWEAYISQDFFTEAYIDAEQIWKELLAKSGLRYSIR